MVQTFAEYRRYWMVQLSRNAFESQAEYLKRKAVFLKRVPAELLEAELRKNIAEVFAEDIVTQLGFHIIPVEIIEMRPL